MAAYAQRMSWTEKMELSTDSMSFTYTAIGYPLEKSARAVIFTNNTDNDIYFTTDPTIDMLKLPRYSQETWDITTQKSLDDKPILIAIGTQFYARYYKFAPPSGGLWVCVSCLIPDWQAGA